MDTVNLKNALRPTLKLMKCTFGIVAVVAGADKFTNMLTHWERYLHPGLVAHLPFATHRFMMMVGVIEIIAGLMVLAKPAVGGFIVAAWLTLIALSLMAGGAYLDVAVRDLVMAVGAFSLARISKIVS